MRPAFYALAPGGWRDYVTLLHLPYTAWHLSYVVVGAALAPELEVTRLLAALAAFALALGIGAHALDELRGRPLGTGISTRVLWGLAAASIGGAIAVGVAAALAWTAWLLPFVAAGGFLVFAYNLEWLGGRFHTDLWFALAWGALPVLTANVVSAERLEPAALVAAVAALFLSLAQRKLSTQVRTVRRRVREVSGSLAFRDGTTAAVTEETLIAAPEAALRLLAGATVAFALALLAFRLY